MYWVTMTDNFFSGWGVAHNKISKFVVECDTYAQAHKIQELASHRKEMRRIRICLHKPRYNSATHHVSTRPFATIMWD